MQYEVSIVRALGMDVAGFTSFEFAECLLCVVATLNAATHGPELVWGPALQELSYLCLSGV